MDIKTYYLTTAFLQQIYTLFLGYECINITIFLIVYRPLISNCFKFLRAISALPDTSLKV